MNTTERHVIFGTGPLGQAVMRSLLKRGKAVRMVNRKGSADVPANVEVVAADVNNPAHVFQQVQGAVAAYQCAQPAYTEWAQKFPPMQRSIVEGVAKAGAKLVAAENLYMYGDTNGAPMSENTPWNTHTKKGKARAEMSRELLDAHKAGKVRVVMGRGSDFYGPGVAGSSVGERTFIPMLQGKGAEVYANLDLPHTVTYIDDFGEALARLGENDAAFGQAWHVPNAPTLTQRQFLMIAFELINREPKFNVVGRMMMRIGGLFIPEAREIIEMMYEFEKPFIVDDSKYKQAFGDHSTSIREGLKQTIAWYQQHLQHA
jgi:nucleoside-diphosphate-sugar epimerase